MPVPKRLAPPLESTPARLQRPCPTCSSTATPFAPRAPPRGSGARPGRVHLRGEGRRPLRLRRLARGPPDRRDRRHRHRPVRGPGDRRAHCERHPVARVGAPGRPSRLPEDRARERGHSARIPARAGRFPARERHLARAGRRRLRQAATGQERVGARRHSPCAGRCRACDGCHPRRACGRAAT